MMEGHEFPTMKVLRNPENPTLTHFPDENGDAYCDTNEELEAQDHPMFHAGVWCSQCMSRMFADVPEAELGMEGEMDAD